MVLLLVVDVEAVPLVLVTDKELVLVWLLVDELVKE